ncbi:protein-glutamate O-methyltransferase CheR [Rhizobium sp. FKL33]|uniref:CheR family methyltransferase n=1 Tax=Rhizobium sp. FKL33 TaxID=2562307 RepID=UPI0010C04795|nr:protein-glutamate O-methyltransferase CheR [Rhizobium sp. FKL33]
MQTAQRVAAPSEDGISKRNFERLAAYIYNYSGIKMPPSKQTMLEGRLRRRLRATGHANFEQYCNFLFSQGGMEKEAIFLIDAVTTNKTDFFREPNHFHFMTQKALPAFLRSGGRRLRVWSSACSTGAEPYTIAMVLDDFFGDRHDIAWNILATDLSTEVLQTARRGIYPQEMIDPVPAEMRRRYVMTAVARERRDVRITPKLRSKVGFARLNLMDDAYPVGDPMHMIFCRNVMIYFDKPTQERVLTRLCDCLEPGGFLFIGHSETISGFDLPLKTVANTVFQKV